MHTINDGQNPKPHPASLREPAEENLFRELVTKSADGILVVDREGIVRFANPAAGTAFGRKAEELVGCPFAFPMRTGQTAEIDLTAAVGKPSHFEMRVTEVEWQQKPACLAILRDITEQKQAAEQIRLLANAVQSTSELISITDLQDRFTFVNQAFLKAYGYSESEVLFKTPEIVDSPRNPAQLRREILEHSRAGGWRGELLNRRKDGSEFPIFLSTSKIIDDAGVAFGLLGVARDITEAKRAEEDVRHALAWQEAIFQGSRDAILISDINARFISVNRAACELTGYSREELLGMRISDLHSEEDQASYCEIHRRIMAGEEIVSETRIRRKDGKEVEAEFNNRRIVISDVSYMHTVARDITERKEAIAERKSLQEQLAQAQKMEAIGQLAGGIAHDFNNLLTVIIGYADTLASAVDKHLRVPAEQIRKAGNRAAALTAQLLAFSRKQMLQAKVIDLNGIVSDCTQMLRRLIGEDIDLVTVLDPNLGCIRADPGQISQVVMNLSVNARDAMPLGGRLVIETKNSYLDERYAHEHIGVRPGHYVMLVVKDTGVGMDKETLSRIFEPFFTTKDKAKGTGLGLATVYGIVTQSDGHIWVSSEVGKGSCFEIYLPLVKEDASTTSSEVTPTELACGSETVMVVEDEEMVRMFACDVLRDKGYNVIEAVNASAAIRLAEESLSTIHLLLTDVVMPGMSGCDLADQMATLHPETKVLYMSGYTDAPILSLGKSKRGTGFLPKPFSHQALILKVRELLNKR